TLFPFAGFFLQTQLFHRIISLASEPAGFFFFASAFAYLTFVLGLAVLLVAIKQFFLLVVITGVTPLDVLFEFRAPGCQARFKFSRVDLYFVGAKPSASKVQDIRNVLLIEPVPVVR